MLVDMHIPDWDPRFLAKFDAQSYVDLIAGAGFQAIMQCVCGGPGLCLWPSRTGKMHANLKGRDLFGEVVHHCRERGLRIVAYFAAMSSNREFEDHPDWRIVPADGEDKILSQRDGDLCPNSPYREYAKSCLREIATYDIDGLFLDGTFWPCVCYCPHCVARYRKERGVEPPRRVNWDDQNWRDFQKAREAWMLEFVRELSDAARSVRPITVNHQFSSLLTTGWTSGQPVEAASTCDYIGGDFYGGPAAYSLACKAFYGLSRKQPFEFHTTATRRPAEHVTLKSLDEIRIETHVATLHSGALCFIDGINPDGTLEPQLYRMLGELNKERAPFEPYLGGQMLADVAVYYDKESMYDPAKQGASPADYNPWVAYPHLQGVAGAARVLQEEHIPFGVITNATLDQLSRYRAAILSNVLEMTREQAEALRAFVHKGGLLYASGPTSLDRFEKAGPRFLLEDVLGVRYRGRLGTTGGDSTNPRARLVTYLTPADEPLAHAIWPQRHATFAGQMIEAQAMRGARVLATVTLPLVPPGQGTTIGARYASGNSDPPAFEPGTSPACVVNSYGAGKAIWIAAPFEAGTEAANHKLVAHLLRSELKPPYRFEADAHMSVEVTLFEQTGQRRLLLGLLSMQQQLPAIPVDATVRVQPPAGKTVKSVLRIPERRVLAFAARGPYIEFKTGLFNPFTMVVVEHD